MREKIKQNKVVLIVVILALIAPGLATVTDVGVIPYGDKL